jgi:hypothetical protein
VFEVLPSDVDETLEPGPGLEVMCAARERRCLYRSQPARPDPRPAPRLEP